MELFNKAESMIYGGHAGSITWENYITWALTCHKVFGTEVLKKSTVGGDYKRGLHST